MDYFYSRFLKGLQNDQLLAHNVPEIHKLVSPLAASYHPPLITFFHLPKSASTYLFSIVKKLSNHTPEDITWGYHQNEQNLTLNEIIKTAEHPSITKVMAKATESNMNLINCFAIKPIIITRSIADIIISIKDHCTNDIYLWPQCFLTEDFLTKDDETKLDIIIDHWTPWCIDFLNSWLHSDPDQTTYLWLTYTDICNDLEQTINKMSHYLDISLDANKLQQLSISEKTKENRFNQGLKGRGIEQLSNTQKERLISFFKHHAHLKKWIGL